MGFPLFLNDKLIRINKKKLTIIYIFVRLKLNLFINKNEAESISICFEMRLKCLQGGEEQNVKCLFITFLFDGQIEHQTDLHDVII